MADNARRAQMRISQLMSSIVDDEEEDESPMPSSGVAAAATASSAPIVVGRGISPFAARDGATGATAAEPAQPPSGVTQSSCRPASQRDYFARVDSFGLMTWFGKPAKLSPLVCARYGWRNSSEDTLSCVTCASLLSCIIDASLSSDERERVTEQLRDRLLTAHKPHCPWRINQSPVTFSKPPLRKAAVERKAFAERALSIHKHVSGLPPVQTSLACKSNVQRLRNLTSGDVISTGAAVLAFSGWELKPEPVATQLHNVWCPCCRRTVPIANFSEIETSGVVPSDSGASTGGAEDDDVEVAAAAEPDAATTPATPAASVTRTASVTSTTPAPTRSSSAASTPASPRWAVRSASGSAAPSVQASPEKRPGLGQDVSDLKRSAAKALSESPRFGAGATRNSGFLFGLNLSFDASAASACGAGRVSDATEDQIRAPKRAKQFQAFDPRTQHRPYCCWTNQSRASRLLDVLLRGDLPQERPESQLTREDLAAAVRKAKALLSS